MNKKILIWLPVVIFYNHFLHFYLVQFWCYWPDLSKHDREFIKKDESYGYFKTPGLNSNVAAKPLKLLVFSDPHLLGPNIVFLDKLWHEYHMGISYSAGKFLSSPDEILILGDILDWGMFLQPGDEFNNQINHFHDLFPGAIAIPGNHDVAFPIHTNWYRIKRINEAFGRKGFAEILALGQNFALVNSIGLSGDGSDISKRADYHISQVGKFLKEGADKEFSLKNGSFNEN